MVWWYNIFQISSSWSTFRFYSLHGPSIYCLWLSLIVLGNTFSKIHISSEQFLKASVWNEILGFQLKKSLWEPLSRLKKLLIKILRKNIVFLQLDMSVQILNDFWKEYDLSDWYEMRVPIEFWRTSQEVLNISCEKSSIPDVRHVWSNSEWFLKDSA